MIKSYRDLIVWQKGMALTLEIQRAAVSIPANIAEGHSRGSRGDYRRHVSVARGSLAEMETHLELTRLLGLVPEDVTAVAESLANEVGRMLSALLRSLEQPSRSDRRAPSSPAP